jgi:hypothetical protein
MRSGGVETTTTGPPSPLPLQRPDHRRRVRVLNNQSRDGPGATRRGEPLRDEAFEPHRAGLPEDRGALVPVTANLRIDAASHKKIGLLSRPTTARLRPWRNWNKEAVVRDIYATIFDSRGWVAV